MKPRSKACAAARAGAGHDRRAMQATTISRRYSEAFDFMASTGWPRLMMFILWISLLICSYTLLSPRDGRGLAQIQDGGLESLHGGPLLLTVAIALPNLLLFVMARILLYRFSQRRFNLVEGDLSGMKPEVPQGAVKQARALWAYERDRTQTRYVANLLPQIAVFGLLASATVSGCILALNGALGDLSHLVKAEGGAAVDGKAAVASVLAAAVTSLLLTIGRLLVRIAGNDATNRTFAHAARSFVLCVLSGVLFACLLTSAEIPIDMSTAVAIGVAVGILGDRAFLAASQRAALLIGADNTAQTQAFDLRLIEGLSSDDLNRLQEENITTVHALAFVPAPRLFFNSSLNFQRICDWQDQALLIEYFGETKAKVLREQAQIRGVTDALALACARGETMSDEDWQDFITDIGFRGDAHTRFLLDKLRTDEIVAVLRVYRRMSLEIERPSSAAEERRSAPSDAA
jgi:hypothetical protein